MKFRHKQILRYCRMYGKRVTKHQWIVGNRWYIVGDEAAYWAPLSRCNSKVTFPLEEKDERQISSKS